MKILNRIYLPVIITMLMTGCGGEGSTKPKETGNELTGAFNVNAEVTITAHADEEVQPSAELALTISGYQGVVYYKTELESDTGIESIDITSPFSPTTFITITGRPSNTMPLTGSSDNVIIRACADNACNQEFEGSPHVLTVNYQITNELKFPYQGITFYHTIGESNSPDSATNLVEVMGRDKSWQASSDGDWLQVQASMDSGRGVVIEYDPVNLGPGSYNANVTITNTDNSEETATIPVALEVSEPTLNVAESIAIETKGGVFYEPSTNLPVTTSVNISANALSATLSANLAEHFSISTDQTGDRMVDIKINARPLARPQSAVGSINLEFDVYGYIVSHAVPVTVEAAENYLVLDRHTVSLYQLGQETRLTDSIEVNNLLRNSNLTWQAESSTTWLELTRNNEQLQISAEPTGLAIGDHTAEILISSSDDGVIAGDQARIFVNLHISAETKQPLQLADKSFFAVGTNARFPFLYVASDNTFSIYHQYSGAHIRDVELPVVINKNTASFIESSSDGEKIYFAADDKLYQLANGATAFELIHENSSNAVEYSLSLMRQRDNDYLVVNSGTLINTSDNSVDNQFELSYEKAFSAKSGETLCRYNESSNALAYNCFALRYSSLTQQMESSRVSGTFAGEVNRSELSLSNNGDVLYVSRQTWGTAKNVYKINLAELQLESDNTATHESSDMFVVNDSHAFSRAIENHSGDVVFMSHHADQASDFYSFAGQFGPANEPENNSLSKGIDETNALVTVETLGNRAVMSADGQWLYSVYVHPSYSSNVSYTKNLVELNANP